MIEVIVGFRDAVFAALVAWTGVGDGDGEAVKAAKDKAPTIHKSLPAEKPIDHPTPRVY
jgi:hypothetical protein